MKRQSHGSLRPHCWAAFCRTRRMPPELLVAQTLPLADNYPLAFYALGDYS
jgi:hypothetical protein